jgi:hypothetical protein
MAAITVAAAIGARARLTRHGQARFLRFATVVEAREDLDAARADFLLEAIPYSG